MREIIMQSLRLCIIISRLVRDFLGERGFAPPRKILTRTFILVGLLVGLFVGWFVCWLVGLLVGLLVGWFDKTL